MKIIFNLADLTSQQAKCLSQLGMSRDEQTWESHCELEEFQEAVALLRLGVSMRGETRARRERFVAFCP